MMGRMDDQMDVTAAAPISLQTQAYMAASRSEATVRAYRSDLADFEGWCRDRSLSFLPAAPEVVADYIADLAAAGRSSATITRRLSAISQGHKMAGFESPTGDQLVRMTSAGIRRSIG